MWVDTIPATTTSSFCGFSINMSDSMCFTINISVHTVSNFMSITLNCDNVTG